MPTREDYKAMLRDGTRLQEKASDILEVADRMVSHARELLKTNDGSDDDDDSPTSAKDLAIMSIKKSRK